ncbi:hypothetical protein ACX0G7_20905 [Flavitalea antarctica]
MKSNLLIPSRYKILGLVILIPSLLLGFWWRFYEFEVGFLTIKSSKEGTSVFKDLQLNFTDEIALAGIIAGLLLIAFSREKHEDEFINRIRLESLQWAVLVNYVLLIIAAFLVYGWSFIDVMMYNMLTVLIIFILRFHLILYKNKTSADPN